MARRIAIYNENCIMAGHRAPDEMMDRGDGEPSGDVSLYDVSEAEIADVARLAKRGSHFWRRVLQTLREEFDAS